VQEYQSVNFYFRKHAHSSVQNKHTDMNFSFHRRKAVEKVCNVCRSQGPEADKHRHHVFQLPVSGLQAKYQQAFQILSNGQFYKPKFNCRKTPCER